MKTKLREGGRIVIPAKYRKAMGLNPGDEVLLTLEDDELKLVSTRRAIARAQALIREYIPEGVSLVDELIKERREEASRE